MHDGRRNPAFLPWVAGWRLSRNGVRVREPPPTPAESKTTLIEIRLEDIREPDLGPAWANSTGRALPAHGAIVKVNTSRQGRTYFPGRRCDGRHVSLAA